MRHSVGALLRLGARRIVLDLSSISGIDAAGIGELVRACNMSASVNGALRVVHATARVRELLERAHLFERLSGARTIEQRLA
jgi:anti-sigma B factor antagonist